VAQYFKKGEEEERPKQLEPMDHQHSEDSVYCNILPSPHFMLENLYKNFALRRPL